MTGMAAVVTGGSQGLGNAVARELIGRGFDRIAIVGRDAGKGVAAEAQLAAAGASSVLFVEADLADSSDAQSVLPIAEAEFGGIHALVCAAAMTDRDSVWDTSVELFDRMIATNLRAPYLLAQGAADNMRRYDIEGSIVNVGSVAGHAGQWFITSYSASKGGLITLTKNLAAALARHRIRVNIVNPGWMDTPAEDEIQRRYHGRSDGWLDEVSGGQPFGRLIDPAEVARQIAFLASPESGLITGAVIDFDQNVAEAGPSPQIGETL